MRVAVGADHAGYALKEAAKKMLEELNIEYTDVGAFSEDSVDYPDYAAQVAERVARGECERGVLVCGTGIGMAIAANKITGIRAAVCHNAETARLSRAHNEANILALGGRVVSAAEAREIIKIWLTAPFEGGRHQTRINKISALENSPRASSIAHRS